MELKVTSYFKHLYDLSLDMPVTDRHGAETSLDEGASQVVEMILSVGTNSAKVMAIGNGGSAAIASHLQNDLSAALGVRAVDFSQVPLLTALSNDYGYQSVFERSVELWADAGDLMVAISSSGQSQNILRAVRAAVTRGCRIVTLSGFKADNPLRRLGDVNFYVPSTVYGYVELTHAALAHFLTDCVMSRRSEKETSHE